MGEVVESQSSRATAIIAIFFEIDMKQFLVRCVIPAALSWLLLGETVPGQDRILLQQPGGSRFPMSGYIEDYTGREVSFKTKPNEPARRYPRADVIEVTTEYTPHHERGRTLFAAGKIAEAQSELAAALNEEDRPWVRREILATQVKCLVWHGDYHGAVSRFLPIVRSDPETFHYGLVPLNWTDDSPGANLRVNAREWIGKNEPPLNRLIGASWLLTVSDGVIEAEQTLKRLTRESDVRIQRLAQMQLWRLKLKRENRVDADEIARWAQFVEGLPVELRGGPYFVIGQAWQYRQEFDRAAQAFLWLPLVYDSDRWLSSRACFEAAESLGEAGDQSQASQLYSEVVFRYGDTPWGKKAESAWNEIRGTSSAAPRKRNRDLSDE
jgi:signal peptidase II